VSPAATAGDPPRQERAAQIAALLFGLAAGPAGWIAQLLLDYGLASYACYPDGQPHLVAPPPGWDQEKLALFLIAAVCLLLALAGLATSWRLWRRDRTLMERPHHVVEVGEGRSSFLALCGVLTSAGFAFAIAVSAASISVVPACWTFRP
jgi:hypothetical protein